MNDFGYGFNKQRKNMKNQSNFQPKETIKEIKNLPTVEWEERGIRKEVMELFGIKTALSEEFGGKISKVYFPIYNQNKKIIGYQVKDLTKEKEEDFHFYTVPKGCAKASSALFGANNCRKQSKFVVLCEGPVDCISIYQSLIDYQKIHGKEKFKDLTPSVVSLTSGVVNAVAQVSSNEDFINNWNEIRLCFDNDELTEYEKKKKPNAMRGKECTESVGAYLIHKDVKVVEYPDWKGFKDPSDFVQKSKSDDLAKSILFNSKTFVAEKIVKFSDTMTFDEAHSPVQEGFRSYSFPILTKKLRGFRNNELTTIASFTSIGKSTIAFDIACDSIAQGYRPGLIFLEEMNKKTLLRAEAWYLQVHPNLYKFDPYGCGKSKEQIKEAWDWSNNNFRVFNHFGSIKTSQLMEKVRYLYYSLGCNPIVFDHLNLAVASNEIKDERREIDNTMTELSSFCAANPVHMFAVCQLNRGASEGFKVPEKPTWRYMMKEYLRGSNTLESASWNIIGIHREDLPDNSRGRIQLALLKNREADTIGNCDITKMDPSTGRFIDASDEVWHPSVEAPEY